MSGTVSTWLQPLTWVSSAYISAISSSLLRFPVKITILYSLMRFVKISLKNNQKWFIILLKKKMRCNEKNIKRMLLNDIDIIF